jgi:3',5'-cyclic AMP phosphodiesterase CpdA
MNQYKKSDRTNCKTGRGGLAIFGIILMVICIPVIVRAALIQNVKPSAESATGNKSELVDFAHTTDVHIMDEGNPLRAEELKVLFGENPALYPDLGWLLLNLIPPAHRNIGSYTPLIWQAIIQSVNDANMSDPMDFLISTGDHTDTSVQDELELFVAIADGTVLPSFKPHTNHAGLSTKIPQGGEGLIMPWYAAVGNHDSEYQGTFNTLGVVSVLIRGLAYAPEKNYYISNQDYLADVLRIESGHGLSELTTGGYYSFDPTPYVHCIVLNTADFNPDINLPLETLSQGVLHKDQFAWMKTEIEKNQDKLCILFAHHGPNAFSPFVKDNNKNYISTQKLKNALMSYDNVIAFVDGHTHVNKIVAETAGNGKGYWDINTCGVADWPQEWRRITVRDNGDGTGTIVCTMHTYSPEILTQEKYQMTDPVTKQLLPVVYDIGVPIRTVSEEENDVSAAGGVQDRDVNLAFAIPVNVKATIIANSNPVEPESNGQNSSQAQANADDSGGGSSGGCFITTAGI